MQFDAVSLVAFHDYWDPSAQVSARYFVAGTGTCIETPPLAAAAAAAHWFSANDAMRHVCASVNYAFIFMIYAFWLTALAVKVFLDFPIQNQIFSRGILVQQMV